MSGISVTCKHTYVQRSWIFPCGRHSGIVHYCPVLSVVLSVDCCNPRGAFLTPYQSQRWMCLNDQEFGCRCIDMCTLKEYMYTVQGESVNMLVYENHSMPLWLHTTAFFYVCFVRSFLHWYMYHMHLQWCLTAVESGWLDEVDQQLDFIFYWKLLAIKRPKIKGLKTGSWILLIVYFIYWSLSMLFSAGVCFIGLHCTLHLHTISFSVLCYIELLSLSLSLSLIYTHTHTHRRKERNKINK